MAKTEKIMDISNMIIEDVRYKCKKKNTQQQELLFDLHQKVILKNAQLLLDAGFLLSPKDRFSFVLQENGLEDGEEDDIDCYLHSRQFDFSTDKIRVLYYFTNMS